MMVARYRRRAELRRGRGTVDLEPRHEMWISTVEPDAAEADLRRAYDRIASSRGKLSDIMRVQSITDREILHVNLIVAYFNFVNRIAVGLGVAPRPEEVGGYRY